ncbi:MAG: universal stress protein [Chitinophagaceae bacterium]|nr:universal stress protein [Chitinophagaceae bacterium]
MQPIIAPTDFSDVSVNAVRYAADMAGMMNTSLIILHVFPLPMPVSEVPVSAFDIQQFQDEAEKLMRQFLITVRDYSNHKITITSSIKPGNALSGIKALCEKEHPYAVVMGAETADALEKLFAGAVTTGAVKRLQWPVIVVPPGATFKGLRKIGLACDFRNVMDTLPYEELKSLVETFKAELHVIHVNTESDESFSGETAAESIWLQNKLSNLKPNYHFIHQDNTEKTIIEFADNNKLDLLIITPKNHDILSRLFLKTYSKKLVLHAHVPVMSIHE